MKPGGGGAQGGNVRDSAGVRRGMWGDTETGGDVEGLGEEKKGRRGLLLGGG